MDAKVQSEKLQARRVEACRTRGLSGVARPWIAEAPHRAESHGFRIGVSDGQRVATLIRQEWSPAEIRERLTREGQRPISHERIDPYLKRDRQAGGTLYRSLRCQRQWRQRYGWPERRVT